MDKVNNGRQEMVEDKSDLYIIKIGGNVIDNSENLHNFLKDFTAHAQIRTVNSNTDGKYVHVNGAKLWVVTVGEGDPIILIAGGPGNAHVGLRSFDALAQNHHQLIYLQASKIV